MKHDNELIFIAAASLYPVFYPNKTDAKAREAAIAEARLMWEKMENEEKHKEELHSVSSTLGTTK